MARAASSLPVPDSPVTSTVLVVCAIVSISSNTASIDSLRPMMFENWWRLAEGALEQHVLAPQPPALERAAHDDLQLVDVERLVDVVVGAHPERLDRRLGRGEGGDHDAGEIRVHPLRRAQHVEPGHVGHVDVRDQQIDRPALELVEGLPPVLGHHHLVALAAEDDGEQLAHRPLVVDDEDAARCVRRPAALSPDRWPCCRDRPAVPRGPCAAAKRRTSARRSAGRMTSIVVPRPVCEWTAIEPPWSLTMRCTMARPSPAPLAKPPWNGWKMRSRSSAGMPTPSSLTESTTAWPPTLAASLLPLAPTGAAGCRRSASPAARWWPGSTRSGASAPRPRAA